MDISKLKRYSLFDRKSLVQGEFPAPPPGLSPSFLSFWQALPSSLKARDLKGLVTALRDAQTKAKPIIWMMGAHAIKTGLSPWLIDAMKQGWITHLAMNGACVIHDFELALCGNTSEDVAEALADGSFGMARETGATLNQWINQAAAQDVGLGEFVGQQIACSTFVHKERSLLANAYHQKVTVSVHVALGTDIIHHHPEARGEAIGKTSLQDFHSFCEMVSRIGEGGVVINMGSAVVLPEVFLKALTVARNLCGPVKNFTTANFDMIQQYRPNENVVRRPVLEGGKGYSFTGHHELMIPLLIMGLLVGE
ncbi:MAG: hypothetical protein RBU29_12760 [bacterium]|jgi:hypothetical protein|nr:hypothetical protein [bacterium]